MYMLSPDHFRRSHPTNQFTSAMGRKRLGSVRESEQDLRLLAGQLDETGYEFRIQMLQLISAHPDMGMVALAGELRHHERTVRRWWKWYQTGGLDLLMSDIPASLRNKPRGTSPAQRRDDPLLPKQIVAFLNSLSTSDNTSVWMGQVKSSLRTILNVSRVTIGINILLDLDRMRDLPATQRGRPRKQKVVAIAQRKEAIARKGTLAARIGAQPHLEQTLENMRKGKFSFNDYHPYVGFDYYTPTGKAIGTIILWQEKHLPKIPQSTIDLMDELKPFMEFLLTDCIARQPRDIFDIRTFSNIVMRIAEEKGLTAREREVLIPHMLGQSSETISRQLGIASNTVKAHITSIHRKSNCKNPTELMAEYLTPPQ